MKFLIMLAILVVGAYVGAEEWKCEEGVPYIENECNGCFCEADGQLSCTLKGCEGAKFTKLESCKVGTISEEGCNKCWCLKNMGTICTNKEC